LEKKGNENDPVIQLLALTAHLPAEETLPALGLASIIVLGTLWLRMRSRT
jgi:hypothetical protein